MTEALVTPEMLTWARERASLDDSAMAAALKVPLKKVAEWEAGATHPSFTHAERWAQVTHVPFGLLYATQPPAERPAPPDFRTIDGKAHFPSLAFRDLYDDVLFKHSWYRSYRTEAGFPPVSLVASMSERVAPSALANAMRSVVSVRPSVQSSADEYYRALIGAVEAAGVWVMRSGTVAGNTSRAVKPDEFRGFAIADKVAPLVFINAADSLSAQIFTLAHELAHLWLGKTGVSDPFVPARDASERLCNAAAAEFLVPGDELSARWRKSEPSEAQFTSFAREFKVSPAVVAIRARELRLASQNLVDAFLEKQRNAWKVAKKKSDGGNFYTALASRTGRRFMRAVLSAALSQELFIRDAGLLLNINPAKVMVAAKKEGLAR